MSNRFHSKYHRHNHHTNRVNDPRYPDAAHDPIASPEYPFMGNFYLAGSLSATQTEVSAYAGSFTNSLGYGLNVEGSILGLNVIGNTNLQGTLSAQSIVFTTDVKSTFSTSYPITATGDFLIVKIAGYAGGPTKRWAIRLWDAAAFSV